MTDIPETLVGSVCSRSAWLVISNWDRKDEDSSVPGAMGVGTCARGVTLGVIAINIGKADRTLDAFSAVRVAGDDDCSGRA